MTDTSISTKEHRPGGYEGADFPANEYREALSRFPSGVTVVVTKDHDGVSRGFTASAFTALSENPPLVLVCLAKTADSHPAFAAATKFAIHIAADENTSVAKRFATKGADKFAGDDFDLDPDGMPALRGAIARLSCSMYELHDGGDHDILIGRVEDVQLGVNEVPAVYHDRNFHTLAPLDTNRH